MITKQLEVACFDLESALNAANLGVDRIEFCDDYSLGGLTPNYKDFSELKSQTDIPIYVMIRPRGGDFYYNNEEISIMEQSIKKFKEIGADGFVFGLLNADIQIDKVNLQKLISLTDSLPITFHRAFDRCMNPFQAIDVLKELGVNNILSSGGGKNIIDGMKNLNEWKNYAGESISWVGGGGVRSKNMENIIKGFDTYFYHTAAIIDDSIKLSVEEVKQILLILRNA